MRLDNQNISDCNEANECRCLSVLAKTRILLGRKKNPGLRRTSDTGVRALWCVAICAMPLLICHLTGCSSGPPTTQPASMADRQNQALNDPMGYKPGGFRDISGGDVGSFDSKSFKQDWDDFMNP
jgi:hypothetical protein